MRCSWLCIGIHVTIGNTNLAPQLRKVIHISHYRLVLKAVLIYCYYCNLDFMNETVGIYFLSCYINIYVIPFTLTPGLQSLQYSFFGPSQKTFAWYYLNHCVYCLFSVQHWDGPYGKHFENLRFDHYGLGTGDRNCVGRGRK